LILPTAVKTAAESVLEDRTGRPTRFRNAHPIGGGCINPSARVEDEAGERYFLKWNAHAPQEMFAAEADGLQALAAPGFLRVPEVMGWGGACTQDDPGWLLMEFIPSGSPGPDYGRHLGEGLAHLHSSPEEATFGWGQNNFIGPLHQDNRLGESWAAFWRDRRILPQFTLARDQGYFGGQEGELLTELVERMEEALPDALTGGGSLLHGDLWSGNYFPDGQGTPVLIDPATYLGDGEVDLAMMELFGALPSGFQEAYRQERGISAEYPSYRRSLYQLYYLLVHVNLFGGSYVGGCLAAAQRTLTTLG
jgi:fructosamine-3-kinase